MSLAVFYLRIFDVGYTTILTIFSSLLGRGRFAICYRSERLDIRENMDAKLKPISDVFNEIHEKFGGNLSLGEPFLELAESHECRARIIRHAGQLLGVMASDEHQKLISTYFDEIFGDMVCSLYFFFTGLDIPGRMMLRRSLELSLVGISYWDDPASFWAWNSKNRDVSFSELEEYLLSQGYARYLEVVGCLDVSIMQASVKELRKIFGILSNVVHPKPYNFETVSASRFVFSENDLKVSLDLLEAIQISLLKIMACRFSVIQPALVSSFPNLEKLI